MFRKAIKDQDFIPALNLANSISPTRPPTKEGATKATPWSSSNTPIFGTITDQEPIWYEEPHPCTEPEAERLVIIGAEKRFYHQREKSSRASPEDTMNFIPWDRSAEMRYEILSFNKYEGDDVVTVDTLDDLLQGHSTDPTINHDWLIQYLILLPFFCCLFKGRVKEYLAVGAYFDMEIRL